MDTQTFHAIKRDILRQSGIAPPNPPGNGSLRVGIQLGHSERRNPSGKLVDSEECSAPAIEESGTNEIGAEEFAPPPGKGTMAWRQEAPSRLPIEVASESGKGSFQLATFSFSVVGRDHVAQAPRQFLRAGNPHCVPGRSRSGSAESLGKYPD